MQVALVKYSSQFFDTSVLCAKHPNYHYLQKCQKIFQNDFLTNSSNLGWNQITTSLWCLSKILSNLDVIFSWMVEERQTFMIPNNRLAPLKIASRPHLKELSSEKGLSENALPKLHLWPYRNYSKYAEPPQCFTTWPPIYYQSFSGDLEHSSMSDPQPDQENPRQTPLRKTPLSKFTF